MPHRYPCLLVDRVLPAGTCIAEGRLSAIKNITANEPTFWSGHAHFAGFPGVLLVSAGAKHRPAGPLLSRGAERREHYYFAAIQRARFYRAARPGDQVLMEVAFVRRRGAIARFTGRASIDGQRICTADFMCARK